jgi:hypothetical protein
MDKYSTKKEGVLFRITALKDFGRVNKGDVGGLITCEKNLSQEGNAWVSGDARVSGDAWVFGDRNE